MKRISFNKFNSFYSKNKAKLLIELQDCLSLGNYVRGNNVVFIEKKIASLVNRNYAICTGSCTDALYFSLRAFGVNKDDEVIVPNFSYIASLSPILRCGATPVFVDIREDNFLIDINRIESAITKKTKAILFVQTFGSCIEFDKLQKIADKYEVLLLEDAAQSLGSKYKNDYSGSFGDISCISFDPTKIIHALGTGGIILTDNQEYYIKISKLIHHGRNNSGVFEELGYNSKISEISALAIKLQLDYLENIIQKHVEVAKVYQENLREIDNIRITIPNKETRSNYHKFVILAERRDELREYLSYCGIETKVHYEPLLTEQKLLQDYDYINNSDIIANRVKRMVLSLPIYFDLSNEDILYICSKIKSFYKV